MSISLDYKGNKGYRLLSIYERLNKGEMIVKSHLASQYGVTEKTIQRDIDSLRAFLSVTHPDENEVVIKYDKSRNGYYLVRFEREWLTNKEVLALSKILLESRAFQKEELKTFIDKLLGQVVPTDQKMVKDIIADEYFHYVPLRHGKEILDDIWSVSQYVYKHKIICFTYTRKDGAIVQHSVKPVAIMFSEFYFYLVAYMADGRKEYPTVFRIDRMENIKSIGENFDVPYRDKFSDGEFRKRVQFMFAGELKRVTFKYSGQSIESVLDRLPTAEILNEEDGVYTVQVEVYGNGIDMWLRSQGDLVEVL